MKNEFIVKKEEVGQRLDKFLIEHYPDYSRAYLKKQIKDGQILVNQEKNKPSYVLKENDKIETQILPPPEISLAAEPDIKLDIIYEDKNVVVLNKSADLTVHPSQTQKNGTLVNGLLAHYPPLKNVGDDPMRPGLVHRLDKDTSGLMIVAKNNFAFVWLKKQFQERKVVKKYLALVIGKPKKLSGKIETFITRSKSNPTKQKVSQIGKEAITFYKAVKRFKDFTLIEATPKTGRMHQIRVHLAWLGNPVAGDRKYGPKKALIPLGLRRQFLHAAYLKIDLPDGKAKEFRVPLPGELNAVLADLPGSRN